MSIHPATFAFLDAIREENSREYFATVKQLYQEILWSVTDMCQELIDRTQITHEDDRPLTPRDCLFRIYRDARRLKEWDPLYKNNFGFVISPRGKKGTLSGYYVHISPWGSYFASGVYWPASAELRNIRHHLAAHGMDYLTHTHHPDFIDRFGVVHGQKLRRPPRGFAHYDHHMDLIMLKQHLIARPYTDAQVLSDSFLEEIQKDIQTARPRSDRLNHAGTTPLQ